MSYPVRSDVYQPPRQTVPNKGRSFRQSKSPAPFLIGLLGEVAPVRVEDDALSYKLIMSLRGIEPRMVYVIASPRSVLIEIRHKSVARLPTTSGITESLDRRTSREFYFPVEICRGGTSVFVRAGVLEITAQKSPDNQLAQWSELINAVTLNAVD